MANTEQDGDNRKNDNLPSADVGTDDSSGGFFDEFRIPDFSEWLALVEADLQGVPIEKKLYTMTPEEIALKPIYTRLDLQNLALDQFPSLPCYTRGKDAAGASVYGWELGIDLSKSTVAVAASWIKSQEELNGKKISFIVPLDPLLRSDGAKTGSKNGHKNGQSLKGLSAFAAADYEELFDSVPSESPPAHWRWHFAAGRLAPALFPVVLAGLESSRCAMAADNLRGSWGYDVFSDRLSGLFLKSDLDIEYDKLRQLLSWSNEYTPGMKVIAVDTRAIIESGGSAVNELGFALAAGAEYVRQMLTRGVELNTVLSSFQFRFGIGSNFFMEVAKFRCFRKLWSQVIAAFGGDVADESLQPEVHALTCDWNKSILDVHTNMLRLTTEALSAAVGGAEIITVSSFDTLKGLSGAAKAADANCASDELFAARIARNTQLVLQHESHIHRVIDPAGGAFFAEKLGDQLGDRSWRFFQDVERQGGILSVINNGWLLAAVKKVRDGRLKAVAQRRDILVGVSMYPDLNEKIASGQIGNGQIDHGQIDHGKTDLCCAHRASQQEQAYQAFLGSRGNADAIQAALQELAADSAKAADSQAGLHKKSLAAASLGATIPELDKALTAAVSRGEARKCCAAEVPPTDLPVLEFARAGQGYEQLRIASASFESRNGHAPTVFLANLGTLKQYKARADFSTAFFAPAGYKVLGDFVFQEPTEAAYAACNSGAQIVVICSADDVYPDLVPQFAKASKGLRSDVLVVLAGYPEQYISAFTEAGVDDFIHVRANNLELLTKFHARVGVAL